MAEEIYRHCIGCVYYFSVSMTCLNLCRFAATFWTGYFPISATAASLYVLSSLRELASQQPGSWSEIGSQYLLQGAGSEDELLYSKLGAVTSACLSSIGADRTAESEGAWFSICV